MLHTDAQKAKNFRRFGRFYSFCGTYTWTLKLHKTPKDSANLKSIMGCFVKLTAVLT